MTYSIWRFIAIASLALVATACKQKTDFEKEAQVAWSYACTNTQYSCAGIAPPNPVLSNMNWYRGVYYGGNDIYINTKLTPGVDRLSTLIHETVHYLQIKSGKHPIDVKVSETCDEEAEAFATVDKFFIDIGKDSLVVGDSWKNNYAYCS